MFCNDGALLLISITYRIFVISSNNLLCIHNKNNNHHPKKRHCPTVISYVIIAYWRVLPRPTIVLLPHEMLSTQSVKGLVLLALFVLTFTFSIIPVRYVRRARRTLNRRSRQRQLRIISFFSCFAGGVFLATCLLDLFPEVRNKLSEVLDTMFVETSYPVAEFVMIYGLFIILITEQFVLVLQEKHLREQAESRKPLLHNKHNSQIGSDHQSHSSWLEQSTASIEGISNEPKLVREDSDNEEDAEATGGESSISYGSINDSERHDQVEHDHLHSMHEDPSSHSTLRSLILTLALSLHSVFEGLAVGLQPNTDTVLSIFVALLIHKCILAFSLGLNLAESRLSVTRIIQSNLVFSLSSPAGVGIGIAISDLGHSEKVSLVSGVLQGIACGTFLYITFFEVLPHELNSPKDRLLKVLCLIVGFSCIAGLLFIQATETAKATCDQTSAGNGT